MNLIMEMRISEPQFEEVGGKHESLLTCSEIVWAFQ